MATQHPKDALCPTIVSPDNSDTVAGGGSFYTFGTGGGAGGAGMSASITYYNNGNLVNRPATNALAAGDLPAGATWGFLFTGCPTRQLVQLTATYTDNGGGLHSTSIGILLKN